MTVAPDRRRLTLRRVAAEEVADVVSRMMEAAVDAVLEIVEIDHKPPKMEINATMQIVDVIVTMEMVKKEKSPEVVAANVHAGKSNATFQKRFTLPSFVAHISYMFVLIAVYLGYTQLTGSTIL